MCLLALILFQRAIKHREIGRKMPWLNQEVLLSSHYASIPEALNGPLRRGDVGIVDQAAPLSDSVRVTFNGVQHNYPRKALLLKNANHFQGVSQALIEQGTPLAALILETIVSLLKTPGLAPECLDDICTCLCNWQFDNSVIERSFLKEIVICLNQHLSSPSISQKVFTSVIGAILAVEASSPPLLALGLYSAKTSLQPERSVCGVA
jgi:hypothetical protein